MFFFMSWDSLWVLRNKGYILAPCHTIAQLYCEPFGTDGKDDCDSMQADFFLNKDTFSVSLVRDC